MGERHGQRFTVPPVPANRRLTVWRCGGLPCLFAVFRGCLWLVAVRGNVGAFFALLCPSVASFPCRFIGCRVGSSVAVSVHRWPCRLVVMVSGKGGTVATVGGDCCQRFTVPPVPANQRFERLAAWWFAVRGRLLPCSRVRSSVAVVVGCRPWQCGRVLCAVLPVRCLVPVSVHRWPWWSVQSGNGGREARRRVWRW